MRGPPALKGGPWPWGGGGGWLKCGPGGLFRGKPPFMGIGMLFMFMFMFMPGPGPWPSRPVFTMK